MIYFYELGHTELFILVIISLLRHLFPLLLLTFPDSANLENKGMLSKLIFLDTLLNYLF